MPRYPVPAKPPSPPRNSSSDSYTHFSLTINAHKVIITHPRPNNASLRFSNCSTRLTGLPTSFNADTDPLEQSLARTSSLEFCRESLDRESLLAVLLWREFCLLFEVLLPSFFELDCLCFVRVRLSFLLGVLLTC